MTPFFAGPAPGSNDPPLAWTVSVTSANGGSCGKIRPNSMLLAGAPVGSECPGAAAAATAALAAAGRSPGSIPADAAASPAPAVPAPAKSLRRVTPAGLLFSVMSFAPLHSPWIR